MAVRVTHRRRGSYGIYAPYALTGIAVLAVAYIAFAIINAAVSGRVVLFLPALVMGTIVAIVFHTTLRGKFVAWAELLDSLKLRGDERILDLGCGRGAVLLMAAQHLTTGRAVGVDLWRGGDQSGNSAAGTPRNPVAGGVAGRVGFATAGMTGLALGHRRL